MHKNNLFFDYWFVQHGVPSFLLTNDSTGSIKRFLATLCTVLGANRVSTTAYHSWANVKMRDMTRTSSHNFKITSRNTKMTLKTFCNCLQMQMRTTSRSTTVQINLLFLSQHQPGRTLLRSDSVVPRDASGDPSPQLLYSSLEARIRTLHAQVNARSKKPQQGYK